MDIEPISAPSSVSVVTALAAEQLHLSNASPAEVSLALAQEKDAETTEELAEGGDQLAVARLAQEDNRLIPISEQQVLPTHASHLPGAHEAGKGDLIDVYD